MHTKTEAIRIKGSEPEALNHAVAAMTPKAREYVWKLFDIEGIADHGALGRSVLELEHLVEESPSGFEITWDDVVLLAQEFRDVWSLALASEPDRVLRNPSCEELAESSEYVLERFDSGDWFLFCRDADDFASLVAKLRGVLPNVHTEVVDRVRMR